MISSLRQCLRGSTARGAVILIASATIAAAATPPGVRLDGDRFVVERDGKAAFEGVILYPEGSGPFPAILLSHGLGGSGEQMARTRGGAFLARGFAIIAPDYAHARRAGDRRDFGASAENIRRAQVCLEILRASPRVDPQRLFGIGNSMGAFVTVGLVAADPEALQAAAILAGGVTPQPGFAAPDADTARRITTPLCIVHGDADEVVPPERSALLESVLRERGIPCERHVLPGVAHQIPPDAAAKVTAWIDNFFARHGAANSSLR